MKRLISLIVLGGLLVLGAYFFSFKERNFPALAVGEYQGVISEFPTEQGPREVSFYVERLVDLRTFLFVLFVDSYRPKVAYANFVASDSLAREYKQLKPIRFEEGGREFLFWGEELEGGSSFKGSLSIEGSSSLEWVLKPTRTFSSGKKIKEISRWLELNAEYRDIKDQLIEGARVGQTQLKSLERLQAYLKNTDKLKLKAKAKNQELKNRLQKVSQSSNMESKSVSALLRELQVLGRISEQGKTVKLLRRLAQREQKWYSANWQANDNSSQVRAILDSEYGISYPVFKKQLAEAQEVSFIQNSIKKESQAIELLESTYKTKLDGALEKKEDRGFWGRLF